MEHRSYHRYPLNLDAQVSIEGFSAQECRVRDFCLGGLFVSFSKVSKVAGFVERLQVGDSVVIHFDLSRQATTKNFQFKANIARLLNGAAGLTFCNPDPAALKALEKIAGAGSQEESKGVHNRPRLGGENVQRILALCRRGVADHLSSLMQGFFGDAEEALFAAANFARNNGEQTALLDSVAELKRQRGKISSVFSRVALDQMDELSATGTIKLKEQDPLEVEKNLSLVNKEEFEDWLILKVMISKAETRLKEPLFALHVRFSQLIGGLFNDENNPVGPSVICHAFSNALGGSSVIPEAEKIIYQAFENSVIFKLSGMYDDVNSVLINSGVLPEIEFSKLVNKKKEQYGANLSSKQVFDEPTVESLTSFLSDQPEPSVEQLSSIQKTTETQQASSIKESKPTTAVNSEQFESAGHRFECQQRIAKNSYQTIQSLIHLQKQTHSAPQRGKAAEQAGGANGPDDALARSDSSNTESLVDSQTPEQERERRRDLLSALGRFQKLAPLSADSDSKESEQKPAQTISDVLTSSIQNERGEEIAIAHREREMLSDMDTLFQAMLEEKRLTNTSAALIRRLEIPLAKVFLQNDQLLSIDQHPARMVINRLAQIGQRGGMKNSAGDKAAENIVNQLVDTFDSDISAFEEALFQLDKLLDRQEKLYSRNVTRLTEACDGQERLLIAKLKVEEEINQRLAGKSVPRIIPVLLDAGWKELLTLAYLKEGEGGQPWKNGLAMVDRLAEELENTDTESVLEGPFDGDSRYQELSEKLEHVISHQTKNDGALNELKRLLGEASQGAESTIERVDIPDAQSSQEVEVEEKIKLEELVDEKNKSASDRQLELRKWIRRAKQFKVGDWINLEKEQEEPIRMRVAWVSEQADFFVYVNHQGLRVIELNLVETVKHLFNGVLTLDQGIDLPLVEFGLDRMVQSVYEELSYQSSHDELTGLVNRKEFERQLDRHIKEAQSLTLTHVLLYLDLDQFDLVNSTCGNDGGDQLLKEVSTLLQHWMTRDGVIARVNGDEFCILIPRCDENGGYQVADNQHVAIQNHRFCWKDVSHTVGASIGLAMIDDSTTDVAHAMKMAQTACSSAKEAGRNRIQVYRSDDSELMKRDDLMGWVIKLNQALDEDRLQLRCQEISPICPSSKNLPHYEILLCIEDENGLQIPPGNFIQAAEQYSRMQTVDRWVISKVFQWMVDHRDMLDHFGGCAINLSGHSLNDEHLMQFVFEQMVSLDIPRNKLIFEVTETATISHLGDAADFIREMRNIGCKFSLDDFGSGLSSYAYLKHLPVDYIKIDGVFVKDLVEDESDYAMVRSINEMAQFLGKETIAEYVENDQILEKLKDIGVDYAQGYGIRKPILLSELRIEDMVPKAQSALY